MVVPSLSIVIPVYNSEKSLPTLLAQLDGVLASVAERYEVVLVNDGSGDESAAVMRALVQKYSWLRTFELMRNYGQHNALLCGIRHARNDVIVTMDDDLQNPPEEIPKLLRKLSEGYDLVYGYPDHDSHGFLRALASKITKLTLQRTMGAHTASRISSFRVFRTSIRDAFENYGGWFVSIDVLLGWGAGRFAAVPVRNPPRPFGQSNYTVAKLISHAVNMITGFSVIPLQIASILGFFFALFGFGALVYVLARFFLQGGSPPGFAFLASLICIFSGVQLFALGIAGEYLARMHFRLMEKPSYSIRSASERKMSARECLNSCANLQSD
jgi:glycosyltransferase involved in cell wall biosynthesis